MRSGALRAGALALIATTTGCRGDSPTKAQYVPKAEAICTRIGTRITSIGANADKAVGNTDPFDPNTSSDVRRRAAPFVQEFADAYQSLHDELAAVKPPPHDRTSITGALVHVENVARALGQAATAFRDGKPAEQRPFAELGAASAVLRDYGAKACIPGG